MDANTQTIYEELKEVARAKQTRFYGELAKLIALHPRSSSFHRILDSINQHEHNEGRPLLSILAVARGYGIPGSGFFDNARKLDEYDSSSGDATAHATFWVDEVHRVWIYWKDH